MISEQEFSIWTRGRSEDEREFGLKRKVEKGYAGLSTIWTGVDEYAAIFSREQIEKQQFDTILMDVDAHKEGLELRNTVRQVLANASPLPSRIYMTGRGAHLYWDLTEPVNGVGRYKQVVAAMVKKWDIGGLVDKHVVGDVRRVARLPESRNSKGGLCLRVEVVVPPELGEWTPELAHSIPSKIELKIGEAAEDTEERRFGSAPQAKRLYSEGEYPPCVRAGIKQLQQTGELDHAQRLHVFSFLVQNDETEKGFEILKRYAGDFDAGISGYQLGRMAATGHQPYKCANVPKDLCPYTNQRECIFWPWIGIHRGHRMEALNHA